MRLIKYLLLALLLSSPVLAADYGRTTIGGSWVDTEIDVKGRLITVPGGEPATAIYSYLRVTPTFTADCKAVLYNPSDWSLAYQSTRTTFTDSVGSWQAFGFTSTVTAGTYLLSIGCDQIPGGANTVEIAYDAVAPTVNFRGESNILAGGQSVYPAFPNPIVFTAPDGTQDISLYLRTSSGGSNVPVKFYHYINGKKK